MSYDIFFVRRDPGQTFEDALDGVEDSYEGGDPGPLSEEDLELWDAVLPAAVEILGPQAEITQDDEETRELTDPMTGIGLAFFQGEFEIHVPEVRATGDVDPSVLSTVYELARAVEEATGLEGYDPQLEEPVSDASDTSPTRRHWADDDEDAPEALAGAQGGAGSPRRWWEIWKT